MDQAVMHAQVQNQLRTLHQIEHSFRTNSVFAAAPGAAEYRGHRQKIASAPDASGTIA
jgi:hypothetical protein